MRTLRPLLSTLCLLLLAACSVHVVRDPEGSARRAAEQDVAAITELGRQFSAAYMRGDVDAMVALYTTDAVIFPGNSEMIRGHDDIRRYWAGPPGRRVTLHRATPTEIRVEGDHAYDYGVFEIAGEQAGTAWGPNRGKYVIVWRREPAGWRMHLDIWNTRPQS